MFQLLVLVFLLPMTFAENTDHVGLSDIKRIERRLQIIEDTLVEERLQRREEFQSVLDKLLELQNAINQNYGAQKASAKQKVNKDIADEKHVKTIWNQILKGFAAEKRIQKRLRRKIQHKLREHSNARSVLSDIKLEVIEIIESFYENQVSNEHLSKQLTQLMEITASLATKSDISSVEEVITDICIQVPQEVSNILSDKLRVSEMLQTDLGLIKTSLSNMTREMLRIYRKTSENEEICSNEVKNAKIDMETPVKTESNVAKEKPEKEFSSCVDLYDAGYTNNSVYKIKLNNRVIDVYCDQTTDGGGWIVFQRRQDGSEDFNRPWQNYKDGFGDLEREFWLGNAFLAELTKQCCHELRIDIGDFRGNTAYAKYEEFKVFPEDSLFELNIGKYSGNAGDSLGYHNHMYFSTRDSDNDLSGNSCSELFGGGWWFRGCIAANLNGGYHADGVIEGGVQSRIDWIDWKMRMYDGLLYSLTFTEMKLK